VVFGNDRKGPDESRKIRLTPRSRIILEKLVVPQLVKKFLTQLFITPGHVSHNRYVRMTERTSKCGPQIARDATQFICACRRRLVSSVAARGGGGRLSKAPYTLSVKLSDFTVWRHIWRKNWVNCAVLTGNFWQLLTLIYDAHKK